VGDVCGEFRYGFEVLNPLLYQIDVFNNRLAMVFNRVNVHSSHRCIICLKISLFYQSYDASLFYLFTFDVFNTVKNDL
jgi:hypothetical protein